MGNLIITRGLGSNQLLICRGYGEVVEEFILAIAQCVTRKEKPISVCRKALLNFVARRGCK